MSDPKLRWLHTECDKEMSQLRNAIIELRDSVLFERGPLAEAGLSSDQVNAVLGVIDDAFSGLWVASGSWSAPKEGNDGK